MWGCFVFASRWLVVGGIVLLVLLLIQPCYLLFPIIITIVFVLFEMETIIESFCWSQKCWKSCRAHPYLQYPSWRGDPSPGVVSICRGVARVRGLLPGASEAPRLQPPQPSNSQPFRIRRGAHHAQFVWCATLSFPLHFRAPRVVYCISVVG